MGTNLEGAAIPVELTADLSFGTVMLVAGQLKSTNESVSSSHQYWRCDVQKMKD